MYDDTEILPQYHDIPSGDYRLFLAGDSITMRFPATAPDAWKRFIIPYKPINFGIDGDRACDLMYRLNHAGLHQISPDFCTILIGVNDILEGDSPILVSKRIQEIACFIAECFPASHVLLFCIFPAEKKPGLVRAAIDKTNLLLPRLWYPDTVRCVDIGQAFQDPNNTLTDAILPDELHLSQSGYEIWGKAIDAMLKGKM